MEKIRYLVLEDGTYFEGKPIGSNNFRMGELVSNTSMIGYQEILSDNSYCGQIVTMTYPMIGGYGITREGLENLTPNIFGIVIGEHCNNPSNWKKEMSVDEFLKLKNIPGIENIDTRMLSKIIKKLGSVKAVFVDNFEEINSAINMLKTTELPSNLVERVSVKKPFRIPNEGKKIVIVDLGSLNEVLKELNSKNMDITIVPFNTSSFDILSIYPDGVIYSNGPGSPFALSEVVNSIKGLVSKVPLLGLGLGHQVISLAKGFKINRLEIDHRGGNYPVKNIKTNTIENVIKNTSYTVEINTEIQNFDVIYKGVNSNTIEALINSEEKIITSQFLPNNRFKSVTNDIFEIFYKFINENPGGKNE